MNRTSRPSRPPTRVNRAQSQQRTRDALLAAAEREFATRGFVGASLQRIAAAAGYTRGAVYANFADKTALFRAVLTTWLGQRTGSLGEQLAAPDAQPLSILQAWTEQNLVPGELRVAYAELVAAGATDPAARALAVEYSRLIRSEITALVEAYCQRERITVPVPAHELATIVVALGTALADLRRIDPDAIPPTLYPRALTYIWNGLAAPTTDVGEGRT